MEDLPSYINITFIACVITTFGFLYYAFDQASEKGVSTTIFTLLICIWIFVIWLLTYQGYFLDFESRPPRLFRFILPAALVPFICLLVKPARQVIDRMPITTLTYIHIIRVPVEIILFWLYLEGMVSKTMTFEGLNYDILSGISAPFAGVFLVGIKRNNKILAIIWNLLALGLLVNIVTHAILATPYFFQPESGEQVNLAVFHFPYILLPTFIVPVVFFSHIVSLYKLFRYSEKEE